MKFFFSSETSSKFETLSNNVVYLNFEYLCILRVPGSHLQITSRETPTTQW